MGWLARILHSRGFGIHSTFAYRFVRECLGERLAYYDYALFKTKEQRLLYRVAAFMQPAVIESLGGADIAPALAACPPSPSRRPPRWIGVDSTRLVAIAQNEPVPELGPCDVAFVVNPTGAQMAELARSLDAMGHGILFLHPGCLAIAVPFATLPRQDIEISL